MSSVHATIAQAHATPRKPRSMCGVSAARVPPPP
jgi:hypothetical protein